MMSKNINLGSGPSGIDGWINYDWGWLPFIGQKYWLLKIFVYLRILEKSYLIKWPKVNLYDLRKGIPLSSDTVNWIYCSNFLEHLEKYETINLLSECFRVLNKKGIIRIVLPDLNKMVIDYKRLDDADIFCKEFYGYDKFIKTNNFKSFLYRLAIRGHQWMYDEKSISNLLKSSGFSNIRLSYFRISKMPDVNKLDLIIHKNLCLYIEAQKI